MMAIGIYVRVSSKSQDTRSQEADLRTWAKGQEDEVVWYRDTFTGTEMTRPGLDKLLDDVRAGRINRVVCWRLDRMGRTSAGLLSLLDDLIARGVGFVSLREGFDLNTAAGRLMAGVLASVSRYENEVRRERQLAGIAKAKEAGKRWGGRKHGTRVKVTQEKESLILKLAGEGHPKASISRLTGLTRKTVYRVLRRHEQPA